MTAPLPSPRELRAPAPFHTWRRGQDRAYVRLQRSSKRWKVCGLPTGIGKGLLAYLHRRGKRRVILTATKGLQDQYGDTYPGLLDMRGMANHVCLLPGTRYCIDGPCHTSDYVCPQHNDCPYYAMLRKCPHATDIVTNYAMWFTHGGGAFGARDLLVLDEAHEIPDQITQYLRVRLDLARDPVSLPRERLENWSLDRWRKWALTELPAAAQRAAQGTGESKRHLRQLHQGLQRLAYCGDDWIAQTWYRGWEFQPLWPRQYAAGRLWGDIKEVVLLSATIRPKTLELLGLDTDQYEWIDCPSPFPVGRRPVYHIPVAKLSARNWESVRGLWLDRIDDLIGARLDRKGIIHTVSYDRAQYLLANSRWREFMLGHETQTTRQVVEEFKRTDPPAILVSPSVHTGWDFPGEAAHYQILAKVPWPNPTEPLTAARTRDDSDYPAYHALTQIVQAAGRIVRAEDDYGETFVLDDHVDWMMKRYPRMVPTWFANAYRSAESMPRPGKLDS